MYGGDNKVNYFFQVIIGYRYDFLFVLVCYCFVF